MSRCDLYRTFSPHAAHLRVYGMYVNLCTCIHVFLYICMYVHLTVGISVYMCICAVYVHVYVYVHAHVCVYMYVYMHMYLYMYVICVCICICICICTCICRSICMCTEEAPLRLLRSSCRFCLQNRLFSAQFWLPPALQCLSVKKTDVRPKCRLNCRPVRVLSVWSFARTSANRANLFCRKCVFRRP